MKRVIVLLIAMFILVLTSCSQAPPAPAQIPETVPTHVPIPEPAPAPTPVPMPELILSNSASDSKVAELEAEIRRLQSENQQLVVENQRLNNELITATARLQNIQSIVISSSYENTLYNLNDIQTKADELAYFSEGLPNLPTPPSGLTVSRINDAIQKARKLREILYALPPPPPLAPSWWRDLDDMKNAFINMTEWMEDLRDIPEFLASSENLEELRSRLESYLRQVQNTTSNAEGTLGQIRDALSP
jgi:chromosome segregation ATPase